MTKRRNKGNTPKKNNLNNLTTTSASASISSLTTMADDSAFTLVSYGKKTRASAVQENTKQSSMEIAEKDMQTVSAWRFKEFQQQLFPAIQDLIAECSNQDHPFIQRWIHATSGSSKINRDSTFRAVADALNLKDIHDYRCFLLTAPNVDRYITFGKNTRSTTVQYIFKPRNRSKSPTAFSTQQLIDSVQHLVDSSSVTTIVDTQSKTDDTNITSPHTDGSKDCQQRPTVNDPEDVDGDSIASVNHSYKVCYGNKDDFSDMMKIFWPLIQNFMEREPEHNHTKQWGRWMQQGLRSETELSNVKMIMGIEMFDQLLLFLRDPPALQSFYDISWDHKIIHQKRAELDSPLGISMEHTHTSVPTTSTSAANRVYQVRMVTDNDMEFCIFHKRVYTEITAWHNSENAASDLKWMQWRKWMFAGLRAIQPAQEIRKIMAVTNIQSHVEAVQPYTIFQQKFIIYDATGDAIKYSYNADNVTPATPSAEDFEHFNSLFHIHVSQLSKAINAIQDKVDACEHTMKTLYAQQKLRFETAINGIIDSSITTFQETITRILKENTDGGYSETFRTHLADIEQNSTLMYEEHINGPAKDMIQDVCGATDDAHASMTLHYKEMLDDFKNQLIQHKQEVSTQQSTPPAVPTLHQSRRFPNVAPQSPFVRKPNPYSKPVADNTTSQHHMSTAPSVPAPAPMPNLTLGPNAHAVAPQPHPVNTSSIPIDPNTRVMVPDNAQSTNHSAAGSYIPYQPVPHHRDYVNNSTIPHTVQTGMHTLPPVNHDQALKRAKIQFSGLGDIFVFYNQLMNSMEQFGIYLLPLPKVKYQMSLCPDSYGGIPIDMHRRQIHG
jgi:hypothetical protein